MKTPDFLQKIPVLSRIKFEKIIATLGLREKGIWRDYFFILLGSAIMGFGIGVFLVNAKVVPGGVTGLSMTVHYLTNESVPVGLMMWVFNIPLFIWGIAELGRRFGTRTFFGFTISSFFVDFFRGDVPGFEFVHLHNRQSVLTLVQNDFLLAVLTGGVLVGLGLGIIFKFKGTTAGTDVVAAVAQKRWAIKPGQCFMVVDFLVIAVAGLVIYFKDLSQERPALTLSLYALFILFISARIIDVIIDGFDYARSATIISSKPDQIADIITTQLERGGTVIRGRGLYTNQDRDMLYTVLSRREIGKLVDRVKQVDPDAFVIVENVHEVLGEGFRPRI